MSRVPPTFYCPICEPSIADQRTYMPRSAGVVLPKTCSECSNAFAYAKTGADRARGVK